MSNQTERLLNAAADHIAATLEQPSDMRAWEQLLIYCPSANRTALRGVAATPRQWPRVFNVKRAENAWHAEISFARCPTDEELQALEILLRDDHQPAPTIEEADGAAQAAPEGFVSVELLQNERAVSDMLREENAKLRVVAQGAREAFRAGWYINAAVDDQPADYLQGCEEVDWSEYAKAALAPEQDK